MTPAPQEQAEVQAAMIHLDAARLRAAAESLLDGLGLDKALAELDLAKVHIVERAHRKGAGEGWSR